jgi:hypothetical protein
VDSIDPIGQGGDETQAGEEVSGGFVVAGGDGAEVLEPTVGAFDDVAPFVALGIKREEPLAMVLLGITAVVPRRSRKARK